MTPTDRRTATPTARRAATALALIALTTAVCTASAGQLPLLGAKAFAPDGEGFGHTRPRSFFNGGDPSGSVTKVHWRHWGASKSYGSGLNAIFRPQGGYYSTLVTIKLRAEDLGACPGSTRPAYRKLFFKAPKKPGGKLGPWRSWSGATTICSFP